MLLKSINCSALKNYKEIVFSAKYLSNSSVEAQSSLYFEHWSKVIEIIAKVGITGLPVRNTSVKLIAFRFIFSSKKRLDAPNADKSSS